MRNKFPLFFLIIMLPFLVLFPSDSSKYSIQEAKKVFRLIEKIQVEQIENDQSELRSVEITESEFNSWIAYRIEAEKEDIMKELRFKVFNDNKIEGKVFIDLRGYKLPKFLRPEMNLYFGGKIEVKDKKARIVIKELYLEDRSVQPMLLDLIIFFTSKIQNMEASSLSDWYELPYGIKDVRTKQGKALFYY